MTGVTHAAAGAAIGAAAAALAGADPAAGAAVGTAAGLLPDIDHPGSYAGRCLRPLACLLEEKFGHRESPAHTLFFASLAGLVLGVLAAVILKAPLLAAAGALGGASHIVLDGMTRSGVKPYRLLLPRLPERLGGRAEKWNAFAGRLEGRAWKGNIRTGQDAREAAICVSCLALLGFLLLQEGARFF